MSLRKVMTDGISLSILGATAAAVIVFALASQDSLRDLRQERAALYADQARKSLISFEGQASHAFDYGDGLLRSVRNIYRDEGAKRLETFVNDAASPHVGQFQGAITVADSAGTPVFHSDGSVAPGTNLAARDYFRYLHNLSEDQLVVSPTDYGAITHQG